MFLWDTSVWSPTGNQLAIVTGSSRLQVGELNDSLGKQIYSDHICGSGIQKVWFAPDDKHIYISTKDYRLNVLSLQDYNLHPNRFQSGTSMVISMAWTSDGKYLATGGIDKVTRIWELDSGKNAAKLFGHTNSISSLFFSADDSRLVSSDRVTTVGMWDWQSQREVVNVFESNNACSYVGFRTNAEQLLLASPEQGVKILDGRPDMP